MTPEYAAEIGLDALVWIASDPDRSGPFLGTSGLDAADIRNRAADPEFLGFVLDYLGAGDDALLDFCAERHLRPETVMAARQALPGGALPNWT